MNKQTLFLLTFISHAFTAQYCLAMEPEKPSASKLFESMFSFLITPNPTNQNNVTNQDFVIIDDYVYASINFSTSPLVFEAVFKDGMPIFTQQTAFSCDPNSPAAKAVRSGRAVYYQKGQGAIIYSKQQKLTLEDVQPIKDLLEILFTQTRTSCYSVSRCKNDPRNIKPAIRPDEEEPFYSIFSQSISNVLATSRNVAQQNNAVNQDFIIINDKNLSQSIIHKSYDPATSPLFFEKINGVFTRLGKEKLEPEQFFAIAEALYKDKAVYYQQGQGAVFYSKKEQLTVEEVQPMKNVLATLIYQVPSCYNVAPCQYNNNLPTLIEQRNQNNTNNNSPQ